MKDYTIERLGFSGDGIAPGPIFVPRALPGEVVTGTRAKDRLEDVRIVTPSSDRVAPGCAHYKSCGGCQLQHATPSFEADWKTKVIFHSLKTHGLDTEIRAIQTSPPASRRRATFAARRTKKGALAGFHARASDVITSVSKCQLVVPGLLKALPMAEALAQLGTSRKAALAVMVTATHGGLDISVTGGKPGDRALWAELGRFAQTHDLARISWDGDVVATLRPPEHSFDGITVTPPPGAFLQATEHGEACLRNAVQEVVADADQVLDLFAGCGTFSLPSARRADVHAVEGAADMVAALDRAWRHADGLRRVTSEARDLFRRPMLRDELGRFDAVILDPPRAGAAHQIAEIAASSVPRVSYVSCNPVTFVRDANTLVRAGFALNWIQPVDQFRWACHVELAAEFTR